MAIFYIDTASGRIATQRQLVEAGVAARDELPPRPWHRVQGSGDATTLWHAVMRKQTHGIFIGTLVIRHSDHHASLLGQGWEEIPVDEIRANSSPGGSGSLAGARPEARSRGEGDPQS